MRDSYLPLSIFQRRATGGLPTKAAGVYLRMKFLQTKILSARISQCRNEINDVLFVFEAGVIHDAISDLPLE